MSSEASVAKAYLSIIPSLAGSQGAIASQMTEMLSGADAAAGKAGASAGQALGASLLGRAKGMLAPAAVAAAVAGIGGGLYQIGAQFDDLADTIRVGTGASGAALDGMVEVAKRVGGKVPVEFDKVGPVVADLNTRLGLTGDTLETVASQYLEAGRILGQDVDIQQTTAAFSAFGIEGDKVQGAMDGLFRVSQATGVGMNELASAAAASAPAMKNLGFSFEETTSLIGSLDKAGLNSSQTLAAMSKGLVTLAKKGEDPQQAFRRVTGEIKDLIAAGDTAKAIDLASGIFGTRAATQFVGAVQSGTLALDDLVGATGATQDTILGVGAETADFAEKWQLVKNNAALALEPLGSAVFGALGEAMGAMVEPMQKVSAWMHDNPAATKVMAVALGALAVGLGVAAAAQWVMNSALLASPITWIIVGIAALVAAITLLATNWDTVTAWISEKGDQLLEWWAGLWDSLTTWVSQKWDEIKTWIAESWQAAIDSVIGIGTSLTQWWTDLWTSVAMWLYTKWNEIITWVTSIPTRIVAALSALGSYLWTTMTAAGQSAYSGLTSAFSTIITWVTGIPSRILSALGSTGTLLWDAGRSIINGFLNGLTSAYQKVKGFISGIGSWIRSHKGPEAYDKALLVPAGGWIMGGLEKGLRAQIPALRQTMHDITSEIQVGATISTSSTLATSRARTSRTPSDPAGTSVTIIQNNPVARRDSALRDDVATGIRLAAAV